MSEVLRSLDHAKISLSNAPSPSPFSLCAIWQARVNFTNSIVITPSVLSLRYMWSQSIHKLYTRQLSMPARFLERILGDSSTEMTAYYRWQTLVRNYTKGF